MHSVNNIKFIVTEEAKAIYNFNTFRPHGVYTLRGPSSHQSGRPLNLKIPVPAYFKGIEKN